MSWTTYEEAIELIERRFQYFPQSFRWRGRRYDVDGVDRDWTTRRPTWHRTFRVRCAAGIAELSHDLASNTWRLRRASWDDRPLRLPRPAVQKASFWRSIFRPDGRRR